MPKLVNPHLVKTHRNYTVGEAADLLAVHPNTVRAWINQGLPALQDRKPTLIIGEHLINFLNQRRKKNKRKLKPGELYCVKCKAPKTPEDGIAFFTPRTFELGSLSGFCPDCGCVSYRQVSLSKLAAATGDLQVQNALHQDSLIETTPPSAISDNGK